METRRVLDTLPDTGCWLGDLLTLEIGALVNIDHTIILNILGFASPKEAL